MTSDQRRLVAWLVTPYFFEERDMALLSAVPEEERYDLNDPGGVAARTAENLSVLHAPIAAFTFYAARHGNLPISIAGDCCSSLPVMAGLQKAGLDPVLVWLDAHGDFNTLETSPSGFLGGMPLAMMVGIGDREIGHKAKLSPVDQEDVWLIGARDLDPLEANALDRSHVHQRSLEVLDRLIFDRPVHLHIDNDVIDASEVPANNYPVPDGPSLGRVIQSCSRFAARNDICAVSFSGWNGALDTNGKTATACKSLLAAVAKSATSKA